MSQTLRTEYEINELSYGFFADTYYEFHPYFYTANTELFFNPELSLLLRLQDN